MTTDYNKTAGLSPITRKLNGHNLRKTQSPLSLRPPYLYLVPTISAYARWNCLATTDASKSRSTPILTVRCSFQRFCASGHSDAAELIRYMITVATTTTRPNPSKAATDVGRCTLEPRHCYKVSMSSIYSQRQKSWS